MSGRIFALTIWLIIAVVVPCLASRHPASGLKAAGAWCRDQRLWNIGHGRDDAE